METLNKVIKSVRALLAAIIMWGFAVMLVGLFEELVFEIPELLKIILGASIGGYWGLSFFTIITEN